MTQPVHYLGADQHDDVAYASAGSKPIHSPDPLVRVDGIAYVMFERPELGQQLRFLEDFGMRVALADDTAIYLRGHGTSPWFYSATRGQRARYLGAGFNLKINFMQCLYPTDDQPRCLRQRLMVQRSEIEFAKCHLRARI